MNPLLLWLLACGPDTPPLEPGAIDTASPASTPSTTATTLPSTPPVDLGSRCLENELGMLCEHNTETLFTGFSGLLPRQVHWQVPLGEAPPDGWPAAILFQGSFFTAETFWTVLDTDAFGYWNQGRLTQTLLDNGYAVVTPEAHLGGFTAWDTNIPPMSLAWELAEDHQFMLDLFDALDDGVFGDVDPDRVYASGISSGGYMTSRVGLEYPARFRALAIHSASYATCSGALCVVPGNLPADHHPTLFLHGTADPIVPMFTATAYRDALDELGVPTDMVTEAGTGHAWIDAAPDAILGWFDDHP